MLLYHDIHLLYKASFSTLLLPRRKRPHVCRVFFNVSARASCTSINKNSLNSNSIVWQWDDLYDDLICYPTHIRYTEAAQNILSWEQLIMVNTYKNIQYRQHILFNIQALLRSWDITGKITKQYFNKIAIAKKGETRLCVSFEQYPLVSFSQITYLKLYHRQSIQDQYHTQRAPRKSQLSDDQGRNLESMKLCESFQSLGFWFHQRFPLQSNLVDFSTQAQ